MMGEPEDDDFRGIIPRMATTVFSAI